MKKLSQVLNRSVRRNKPSVNQTWPLPDQLVGIEIEIENTGNNSMPRTKLASWTGKSDGSLRNGKEFVLQFPLSDSKLTCAIEEFFEGDVQPKRMPTSSTHVHLDLLEDVDVGVVVSMYMLCYVIEDAIFAMNDPGREHCSFCNKLNTAPMEISKAIFDLESDRADLSTALSMGRYYGLNLQALEKYGSIEFRYFPTARNADELRSWVRLCMQIKRCAYDYPSRDSMYKMLSSEEGWKHIVNTYFEEWRVEFNKYIDYTSVAKELAEVMVYGTVPPSMDRMGAINDVPFTVQSDMSNDSRFKDFFKKSVRTKTKKELEEEPFTSADVRAHPRPDNGNVNIIDYINSLQSVSAAATTRSNHYEIYRRALAEMEALRSQTGQAVASNRLR